MVELGIVDIREIIRVIKSKYDFDFSNFALTSFKYSLEKLIARNNLASPERLFRRLSDDEDFMDEFLHQIFIPSTEMFRDPSLWRWLREELLLKLSPSQASGYKIWLPYCVSGGELYTLAILLKEINLLDRVKIFATVFSEKSQDYILSGNYPLKKTEVSTENYKRFHGSSKLDDYYEISKFEALRDNSLIKNVEFIKDDVNFSNSPKNVKLIMFRNMMIYANPKLQAALIEKMYSCLSVSGHFVIGAQERLKKGSSEDSNFEIVNASESIYKKKL